MSLPGQGQRIVWLVRTLTAVGLVVVIVTLLLMGWTLARVRTERAKATAEQAQLNDTSDNLRQFATESRGEIQVSLDETQKKPEQRKAVERLAGLIHTQLTSHPNQAVLAPLQALDAQVARLVDISGQAAQWRDHYDMVWNDMRQQVTVGKVRALVAQLHGAVEDFQGKRRLAEAIRYKQWRDATGDDAVQRAQAILLEFGRQQTQQSADFNNQLAELARLVELLNGAEQIDNLADLRENQFKPVLESMSRSIAAFGVDPATSGGLTAKLIDDLEVAVFGQDYLQDPLHQNLQVGQGGLYALRRAALQFRRERETLKNDLAALFQSIETANAEFTQSTQERTAALAREIEDGMGRGWQQMCVFGVVFSGLFLWLAWLITRGIKGQVSAIEQARADAEQGRQTTQKLMVEQQAAAAELAAAHAGLQTSERRFRTLSVSAPIGIFEADASGGLIYVNPHWEKTTGRLSVDSLGDGWQQALHPEDAKEVAFEWKEAVAAGREFEREFRFQTQTGEVRWVFARTASIRSDIGKIVGQVGTVEDITERKRAEEELEQAHRKLLDASRQAGMAEIATSVLHNVGNVLNSLNVSVSVATSKVQKSPVQELSQAVGMITQHKGDLGGFLTDDEQGKQIAPYLEAVAEVLTSEQTALLEEMRSLAKNVEHIKQIVSVQQSHAKVTNVAEEVDLPELLEDALRVNTVLLERNNIEVAREFAPVSRTVTDKHMVLQILINLLCNAKHAVFANGKALRHITLRTAPLSHDGQEWLRIEVADNGVGIEPANITRIFNHGFTTKKDGHGFGLHSSANSAKQLGGFLTAQSAGPGQGATFALELPLTREVVQT